MSQKIKRYNSKGSIDTAFEWADVEQVSKLPEHEYLAKLNSIRQKLEEVMECNFPRRNFVLMTCLAVKAQLMIEDITQPFALFLLGNPSTGKSTILEILGATPGNLKIDKFTPRSFVSHSANSKVEDLGKIDLLPQMKDKTLITPELAPLFSANPDDLLDNFATLTRILDGKGYTTSSGVHGIRGYSGDYNFMWTGAIVDIPFRVWKLVGNLGSRWFFYRIPEDKISSDQKKLQLIENLNGTPYNDKLKTCKKALNLFWGAVKCNPAVKDGKIIWDKTKDDVYAKEKIIEIAILLSRLRGSIPTWFTKDTVSSGSNYNFEMPKIEDPDRAGNSLYNLARGFAALSGRNYITRDDLLGVIGIALSSAQKERVALFDLLIQNDSLDTEEFSKETGVSENTGRKHMMVLEKLGIGVVSGEGNISISLKKEFEWFKSAEFLRLYSNFKSMHTTKTKPTGFAE